jgi:hypothetical protein
MEDPANCHASSVPLIYNPITTHITPQFHVIFDENFKTATGDITTTQSSYFDKLYESAAHWMYQDKFTETPYTFTSFWTGAPPIIHGDHQTKSKRRRLAAKDTAIPIVPLRGSTNPTIQSNSHSSTPLRGSLDILPQAHLNQHTTPLRGNQANMAHAPNLETLQECYSAVPEALKGQIMDCISTLSAPPIPTAEQPIESRTILHDINTEVYNIFSALPDLPLETPDVSLHAFPAVDSKADTLTQSQMLSDPDRLSFIQSQLPEIQGLLTMDVFNIKKMSELPPRARLLSSIWSYKCKRSPTGQILKHKSRLCVDGPQQEFGRDFWETYAPVISWTTIHLLLLLASISGLKTRQVDYTQAFPQAPLDDPVFMRMPQGWFVDDQGILQPHPDPKYHDRNHFIQLKKNLYGCKQAARNWFKYLTSGLLSQGFVQSKHDPCLFLRHDCLMVVYTDDCLIFARDDNIINDLIQQLSQTYILEDQGRVQDYLGIRITKDTASKTITMAQPGLIESILNDLHITNNSKPKDTPALGILYPDHNGYPRQESWNFRSLIGKLNFLAQNTRPDDISFAVHQCARFSSKPTALHELAVKRIGRYLLATKDRGLTLQPRHDYKLDMYVDADFAGMWHQEYSHLRDCALSRSGYVITYCGCPIHWASKLQSEIALSTTESEYKTLSMATRELLPLRQLVTELHQNILISTPLNFKFSTTHTSHLEATTIYEDNARS